MLKLILGRAGTGKTAHIMEEIRLAAEADRRALVLLVPEQYSHEAERELCRICGDRLCLCAEVLSFTRLATRVFDELGLGGEKPLDKGGRLLAMALACDAVSHRLGVYSAARRSPQLQKMLLEAADELKTACVTPAELERAAESADRSLSGKMKDLALVAGAYEAVTARSGLDPMDRLNRLAENLSRSAMGTGGVYIDGFTDFTAQELEVIRAMLERNTDVTVCLTCDTLQADGVELFEASRRAARRLLAMAESQGHPCETVFMEQETSGKKAPLAFLEKHLFTYTAETCEDPGSLISLGEAESLHAECELAAARVLELVRCSGCRWRDVAVAVRGFEDYRCTLENVFAHYGIPLYAGGRTAVLDKPLPALIAGAFEILSGGWEADDVLGYLKTGLTGIDRARCDMLENYVRLWNLRGRSIWTRQEPWTMHPEGFSGQEDDSSREKLRELDALRRKAAKPLESLYQAGQNARTAAEQAAALAAFLEELALAPRLETLAAGLEAAGEQDEAMEYRQLWDILVAALEQCAAILGDMPMEQEDFGRLFCLVLSQYDIGTIPVSLDRVSAGDMDRMRRRHIRHLIVLGASDDRLPQTPGDTGVFSADERERLEQLGLELGAARDDSLYRELCLVYNCLTLPSETLTMTYPSGGGDGAGRRPSYVMHRLAALTEAPIKPLSVYGARTAAVAPAMELAACAMNGNAEPQALAVAQWMQSQPLLEKRLEKLGQAASLPRGRLQRQSVRMLYGDKLRLSATRADTFASCKFKYFMQYGLRARTNRPAGFDPPEMGTFMHYVLEGVCRAVMEEGGFQTLSEARLEALTDLWVEKYIHEVLGDFREKSSRFVYLFRRLTRSVRQVVGDMARELAASDFVPLDFELDFSAAGEMAPVTVGSGEEELTLTGVADRVDGWVCDGKLYLRVVDYKTGRKAFDFTDVYNGLGLQMLLYLFTLQQAGSARYGMEVVPAGVLYAPARDVLVRAKNNLSEDELAAEKGKTRVRSGLILEEQQVVQAMEHGTEPRYLPVKFKNGVPTGDSLASLEQFGRLSRHIQETLSELAVQLHTGGIDADPYFRSSTENACLYCDYYDACHFDEQRDHRRRVSRLKAPEFWQKLDREDT